MENRRGEGPNRAEGKADQTIGEVKQVADKVKQAVKNCAAEVCRNRIADAEALPKPALFHQRKRKIMSTTTLLILIIVLFLVFGGGGGYYWNRGRGR